MSSSTTDSPLVDVLLRPAFVLGVLLAAALAYSVVVLQSLRPFIQVTRLLVVVFVVWLLYRLVVAVEDIAGTARRLEASRDDE